MRSAAMTLLLALPTGAGAEIAILDQPVQVIVGQTFRVLLDAPAGAPAPTVELPATLELIASTPPHSGTPAHRCYFRAVRPGPAPLVFRRGGEQARLDLRVLSWPDVLEPGKYERYDLPRVWPVGGTTGLKTRRTWFTDDELAAQRESKPAPVDPATLPSPDDLYDQLLGSYVPRNCFVNAPGNRLGCPRCGTKVYQGRSAFYPWTLDFAEHRGQVGCPECGGWFPTNRYLDGDMATGDVIDDGYGADFKGYRLSFVAYYNEWHYLQHYLPLLRRMAEAYTRTGDREYARRAAVMLLRIAEQYLNLAVNLQQRKERVRRTLYTVPMGILPRTGMSVYNTWMYVQHNWEVPVVKDLIEAYERIFDYLQEPDPALLDFCRAHHHPEIADMADYRRFVETGYFRALAQCVMDRNIFGNLPQGQRAMVELALFLDTSEVAELVDWTFNGAGQIRFFLTNGYFKDGSAYESQGYNAGHVFDLQALVDVVEKLRAARPEMFAGDRFPVLVNDPKYRYLYDFALDFALIGRTHAQSGDNGDVAPATPLAPRQTTDLRQTDYLQPFRITGDPRYAQALHGADGKLPGVDDQTAARVRAVVAERGWRIELPSGVCDGFGHAILRSGTGDDQRALWIRYGRSRGHMHDDLLTIGLEALQRKLLPELGYPHSWQYRWVWEANWATHYCFRPVGEQPRPDRKGSLALFSAGELAQVATATAPPYLGGSGPTPYKLLPDRTFERTIALVDLDAQRFYAVDVARLDGGQRHVMAFHGPRGQARYDGPSLREQKQGTALGPEVAYGTQFEEGHELAALAFLDHVRRGPVERSFTIDVPLEGQDEVHLRTTVLPPPGTELILAKGRPPGGGSPFELDWVIQSRPAEAPGTQFVQVLDAWEGRPAVDRVERVATTTPWSTALRVVAGGRTDLLLFRGGRGSCATASAELDGAFGMVSTAGDGPSAVVLADGSRLTAPGVELVLDQPRYEGTIAAVDHAARTIEVQPAMAVPAAMVGRYARLTNDGGSDTSYRVVEAANVAGGTRLVLDLDPRLAEGHAVKTTDQLVLGEVELPLGNFRYYQGKTLANQDGSVRYRTSGCASKHGFWIDPDRHGQVRADQLAKEFVAAEGERPRRYTVYDYGLGDTVTIAHRAEAVREGDRWRTTSTVAGRLRIGGRDLALAMAEPR